MKGGIKNTMSNISRILREIIEQREGKSIKSVAKAIGVDHGSLYRALKDGGNPEGNTIEKILDYLGYDLKFIKQKEVSLIMKELKISCPHCKKYVVLKRASYELIKCPECKKPLARKGRLLSEG